MYSVWFLSDAYKMANGFLCKIQLLYDFCDVCSTSDLIWCAILIGSKRNHFNALNHGDLYVFFYCIIPIWICSNQMWLKRIETIDLCCWWCCWSCRWMNNLMIKYKNGSEIANVILLDFQYSCWTSPAIDLHYFFNNSLQECLWPDRFDELLEFYH